MVVGGAAHGFAELADPGPAGGDPVSEGAGLLEFAEEGGAAAQPVQLFGRLPGVLRHGRTSCRLRQAPRGGGRH